MYCLQTTASSVLTYGTAATKGKGRQDTSFDIGDALEQQGARILRVVKAKVDERHRLLGDEVFCFAHGIKTPHLGCWD